ncbi:hypothetical protein FHU30_000567 [Actinomadura rupiterrae]|nr:hypothetical protein [Actinomadura rupiterrae]
MHLIHHVRPQPTPTTTAVDRPENVQQNTARSETPNAEILCDARGAPPRPTATSRRSPCTEVQCPWGGSGEESTRQQDRHGPIPTFGRPGTSHMCLKCGANREVRRLLDRCEAAACGPVGVGRAGVGFAMTSWGSTEEAAGLPTAAPVRALADGTRPTDPGARAESLPLGSGGARRALGPRPASALMTPRRPDADPTPARH